MKYFQKQGGFWMAKCNYKIEYLPSFNEEFDETLYYIIYKLNNREAAEKFVENIQKAIINRSINPESFELYKEEKKRKYKWYRIYVGNYIIFYTVKNNVMQVARLLYHRRNFEKLV